jgi:shikimate kinase
MSETREKNVRRIVLTGFMGSGKSTVGLLVAARLGWRFVDADPAIEAEAGMPIAEIFRRSGEAEFRRRERETIARLATESHLVLALGGGAIEDAQTRALLLAGSGTQLVHLEVQLATTLARCGADPARPVLNDRAHLEARYLRRLPLYRLAHSTVVVDRLSPAEAAEAILAAANFLS